MMGALFGGPRPAPLPAPRPVTPMPDADDPAVLAAKRRASMEARARSGRESTILSGDYAGDKLGTP